MTQPHTHRHRLIGNDLGMLGDQGHAPVSDHPPLVWYEPPGQAGRKGALARTVMPNEGMDLAGIHGEVHRVQGWLVGVRDSDPFGR